MFTSIALGQVSETKFIRTTYARQAHHFPPEQFHFAGHLGSRIDACIRQGIAQTEVEMLVEPFRHRNESHLWQSEFWGKWMLSAAKAYQYSHDTALLATMKRSVYDVISTQSSDGYIGNYTPADRLKQWDVWGSKYTLLGLIYYYDLSGEKKVLTAARALADNVLSLVGPGKASIVKTGNYRGMPSSSILEPMMLLYERTNDNRYLEFGKYIVAQWETPAGPQLISKSLAHVPVSERFTDMKEWWGWENGQKAYEMMSCYDGLLKLYQFTGEPTYLQAVVNSVENIRKDEITIAGSGSAFECWYSGAGRQTVPTQRSMETCVTTTWIKLCYELFRITGDVRYANEIEKSAYNHLLGALMPNGDRFSMYSSLQGYRDHDGYQCNMNINCCMANGPRGLMLLQDLALTHDDKGLFVNLYNKGTGTMRIRKDLTVNVELDTQYPENGEVTLRINPDKQAAFVISLRIPSWAISAKVTVNGVEIPGTVEPDTYLKLEQTWKKGDVIKIVFDVKGRVTKIQEGGRSFLAVQWGPLVLAEDSRFTPYGVDTEIQTDATFERAFKIEPVAQPGTWLGFKTTMKYGLGEHAATIEVPFVDFSSAGNGWDPKDRFRVWIPVVTNLIDEKLRK